MSENDTQEKTVNFITSKIQLCHFVVFKYHILRYVHTYERSLSVVLNELVFAITDYDNNINYFIYIIINKKSQNKRETRKNRVKTVLLPPLGLVQKMLNIPKYIFFHYC